MGDSKRTIYVVGNVDWHGRLCRSDIALLDQRLDSKRRHRVPAGNAGREFLGAFLLSLVMYLSEFRGYFNEETRIFLSIGVLGSFTTMSTFSFESFKLLEQGEIGALSLNVAATLILTFLAVYLGKIAVVNMGWE